VTTTRPVLVERRRFAGADHLRRHLRDADAQLYQCRRHSPPVVATSQKRRRVVPAIAACLAAGVALIAASDSMHSSTARVTPPVIARAADPLPYPGALPTIEPTTQISPAAQRHVVERRAINSVRRGDVKPARSIHDTSRSARRVRQRGLLERMRLQWLKKPFAVKADLE
jgi:hypothetical protein